MDNTSNLLTQYGFNARSMGLKLIAVGALALIMTIPAWLVANLVDDRSRRAAEVTQSIAQVSGGPQTLLGPVLAVPIVGFDGANSKRVDQGVYVIFPARGEADVVTKSEARHRSLFKVAVYVATIEFKAFFEVESAPANLAPNTELDWSRAEFITGASDSRGALADVTVTSAGTTRNMGPSGLLNRLSFNVPRHPDEGLKVFGLRAGTAVGPGSKFEVAAAMKFSGSQRLSILPFGKNTGVTLRGNWPHPSFNGGFLPVSQTVAPAGFQARWSIPFIARGIASEGQSDLIANLMPLGSAVSFIELADPYQSVNRSLKYALLFLCLVFAAFFVFEATTGKRVHPAQYILIGVAQLIFYLLLLSIAERLGFGPAFFIASAATVSLISIDANWIFASRRQGARALAIFSSVYGLIYLLLTLEDQALLIGSIASFLVIAVIMYFTRSIDWYGRDVQNA